MARDAVQGIAGLGIPWFARENQSIYLHRASPFLENGLDRPKHRYSRYGFPSFCSIVHMYRRGGWSQSLPLKIFFSCPLGGGGSRYFSVPRFVSLAEPRKTVL